MPTAPTPSAPSGPAGLARLARNIRLRPLTVLACAYAAGTWAGLTITGSAPALFGAALLLLLVGVAFRRAGGRVVRGVATGAFFLSVALAAWGVALVHPRSSCEGVRILAERTRGQRITFVGTVSGDPDFRRMTRTGGLLWSVPFRTTLVAVGTGACEEASFPVQAVWYAPPNGRSPSYGDLWRVAGAMGGATSKTVSAASPAWTRCRIRADYDEAQFISDDEGWWFPRLCFRARQESFRILGLGLEADPEGAAIPRAMVLNYRSQVSSATWNLFALTGTIHIFAISGMNVVIFAALVVPVLTLAGVPRMRWVVFLAPVLIIYTVGTGCNASAVRACIMAIVFFLAPLIGRRPDLATALAAAAWLILAANPTQIFDAGFVLSFVVVAGLVAFCPMFDRWGRRVWEKDPLSIVPDGRLTLCLRSCGRYAVSLGSVSLAAWLSSTPLIAYYFNRFTPIALPANFVVVPLSFLSLVAASLSLATGLWAAWLAGVFNHANWAISKALVLTTQWMASVPGGCFELDRPPLWSVWLWYAVLAAWVVWWRSRAPALQDAEAADDWDPA